MEKTNKMNLLSARKQEEVKKAIDNAVAAGVQYNLNYNKFDAFRVKIDTEEKRNALVFLLDDLLELTDLDFRMAPVVESLGEPKEVKELTYRQFKLLQELMKNVRIRGRQNLLNLSKSMKAFNEDGRVCEAMEEESRIFVKAYQDASTYYSQLCKKFGIMPDDLQEDIEKATEEKMKEELSKKN